MLTYLFPLYVFHITSGPDFVYMMKKLLFLHLLLSGYYVILAHGEYLFLNTYPKGERPGKILLVRTEGTEDVYLQPNKGMLFNLNKIK